jgi:hypothetical protein
VFLERPASVEGTQRCIRYRGLNKLKTAQSRRVAEAYFNEVEYICGHISQRNKSKTKSIDYFG